MRHAKNKKHVSKKKKKRERKNNPTKNSKQCKQKFSDTKRKQKFAYKHNHSY